jgi:hypothetical protein
MKVSDATCHVKPYATHQMMITKLQTYNLLEKAKEFARWLEVLKIKMKSDNWFIGSVRIPKFDYKIQENKITIEAEYMFGKQLDISSASGWRDIIYNDMVDVDKNYGFRDYTFDNFIIRETRPLGIKEPNWTIAYVDLEAFCQCTKVDRIDCFKRHYERWML